VELPIEWLTAEATGSTIRVASTVRHTTAANRFIGDASYGAHSGARRRRRSGNGQNVQKTEQRRGIEVMEQLSRNRRIIEDFTQRSLSAISSEFGRLAYVAGLREPQTGAYSHSGLAEVYSPGGVQEALSATHELLFSRVLQLPLAQQLEDLNRCLADSDTREFSGIWKNAEFQASLCPVGTTDGTNELFAANLEALLEVIENDATTVGRAA